MPKKRAPGLADPTRLRPFPRDGKKKQIQVVIETPRGCRNKYAFDPEQGVFTLRKVLPEGMAFPLDFGFIPSTEAEDGDPLDVLVLMDEPAFAGCLLEARLVGAILGRQSKGKKTIRNDRLIAVAEPSHTHSNIHSVSDLNETLLDEVESFLENYHQHGGDKYESLGRKDAKHAFRLLRAALKK